MELTATTRAGVHRYTFPRTAEANVVLDLTHRDEVLDVERRGSSGRTSCGGCAARGRGRATSGSGSSIRFSRPFVSYGLAGRRRRRSRVRSGQGKGVKAHVRFDALDGRPLEARVGISASTCEGAARNLDAEVGAAGLRRDSARGRARRGGRSSRRSRSTAGPTRSGARSTRRSTTACLAPNVFSDVDGRYRGSDRKVHEADGLRRTTRLLALGHVPRAAPAADADRAAPHDRLRPHDDRRTSARAARCRSGSSGATRRTA